MNSTGNTSASDGGTNQTPKRSSWPVVIGIILVLAAVGNYVRNNINFELGPQVLLQGTPDPIEVSPELTSADRIPLDAGMLAGANVLLITADTTRADRIGCYGNEAIQTPNIDQLAKTGALFSVATAVAPTTLPSHTSILTGQYPATHGVRANGLYRLADEHETLTEVLKRSGYQTFGIVSAFVLDSQFGLGQGFDVFDDDFSDSPKPSLYGYKERKADKTTDHVVSWLKENANSSDPFFMWVHYFDPHSEYDPPEPYAEQYKANLYDGEIAYMDEQIGRLLAAVNENDRDKPTLIVLVADHGDSLGQHSEYTHGFLAYEATLRVPMIFHCEDKLSGVHVDRRVSQVDVMPTVLSLLGIDKPKEMDGTDLTQAGEAERPVFAETLHGTMVYGWAPLIAVYEAPYKYIHGPKPELYRLDQDPHELNSIIADNPDEVQKLRERLGDVFGDDLEFVSLAAPDADLSFDAVKKLGALGYLMHEEQLGDPNSRPNPADMMAVMHEVERVVYFTGDEVPVSEKIARLEAIVAQHPDFLPALRFLGDMHRLAGQYAEAEDVYEQCLKLDTQPVTIMGLALSKSALGKWDEATQLFRDIVDKHPDHLDAQFYLGMIAMSQKNFEEAIKRFRAVFEINPDHEQPGVPPTWGMLVWAHLAANRGDEVRDFLEGKLAKEPDSASTRLALSTYYILQKQYEKAGELMRQGLELSPNNLPLISNYSSFLVDCPNASLRRPYEAVDLIEAYCKRTGFEETDSLFSLALIYAGVGRVHDAQGICNRAMKLAQQRGEFRWIKPLEELQVQLEKGIEGGARFRSPLFPSQPGSH